MLRIKRLYTFVIQEFFPLFLMTFFISLFVFLMQFVWQSVEEMVGKGIDISILGELFFYAALNLVPMVLPLAILLASIMTFGNMGERLELLAIKAAGISLMKTMRPLIVFIVILCISAFFFQNEVMPRVAVKFRALLISIKKTSPELDIPEGSFYSGISNYSIYVEKKNRKTGMLYDVMIYDRSDGFDNLAVFVCDSAHMTVADGKDHLELDLYHGQRFANFTQGSGQLGTKKNSQFVPYGRENFRKKTIIIPFDTDFSRMEEDALKDTQIAKNLTALRSSIDTMSVELYGKDRIMHNDIKNSIYGTHERLEPLSQDTDREDMHDVEEEDRYSVEEEELKHRRQAEIENDALVKQKEQEDIVKIDFDSLMRTFDENKVLSYVSSAVMTTENTKNKYAYDSIDKLSTEEKIRRHKIEWHQKFVLSFACLIFFFIGAPLGSIIRKGGMGVPIVISIILFLFYYVINNIGYKLARDNIWYVWQGVWLSSFVLFPLGVFLTYKSMNDSELFNTESYAKNLRKLLRMKPKLEIVSSIRMVDLTIQPETEKLNADETLVTALRALDIDTLKDIARNYRQYDYDEQTQSLVFCILKEKGSTSVDIVDRQYDYEAPNRLFSQFKLYSKLAIVCVFATAIFAALHAIFKGSFPVLAVMAKMSYIGTSIGFYVFLIKSIITHSEFTGYVDRSKKAESFAYIVGALLFGLVIYIFVYIFLRNKMKKDMQTIKW